MTNEEYVIFKSDLVQRLETLGYTVTSSDEYLLKYLTMKVENDILGNINATSVPVELYEKFMDAVCGELLDTVRSICTLTDANLEGVVKQITMGDTSVTYDDKLSAEALYEGLVNSLKTIPNEVLSRYRKLKW